MTQLAVGFGCPKAIVSSLVCEAVSSRWLVRVPKCLKACVSLMVGGAGVQEVTGLVLAYWWVEPCSPVSGCSALWIPKLMSA